MNNKSSSCQFFVTFLGCCQVASKNLMNLRTHIPRNALKFDNRKRHSWIWSLKLMTSFPTLHWARSLAVRVLIGNLRKFWLQIVAVPSMAVTLWSCELISSKVGQEGEWSLDLLLQQWSNHFCVCFLFCPVFVCIPSLFLTKLVSHENSCVV